MSAVQVKADSFFNFFDTIVPPTEDHKNEDDDDDVGSTVDFAVFSEKTRCEEGDIVCRVHCWVVQIACTIHRACSIGIHADILNSCCYRTKAMSGLQPAVAPLE